MRQLYFTASVILLFLLVAISSCISDSDIKNEDIINPGDKLPDFEIAVNNGDILRSIDLVDTNGVFIFFNTSCSDCQRELPKLQEVYEATKANAFWIAISREETEESIENFWEGNNITIPYSAQPDRKIYNLFATIGIPRIYITSANIIKSVYDPSNIPSAESLLKEINDIE